MKSVRNRFINTPESGLLTARFQFCNFAVRFSVYCLALCFKFELSQTTENKSSENYLYTRIINTLVNF